MVRQARQESSTGYYHVMIRGINRESLFSRELDKKNFLELIVEQQASGAFELALWCLMDNHAHLIVQAELNKLSKAIKIISLKFAARYNHDHKRSGPVFGDRYRSENIEDDSYLIGATRYIHNNPVKAKLVSDPTEYDWSSFGEYLNEVRYIGQAQKEFVLGLFGDSLSDFAAFHRQEDDVRYLEISEDVDRYREELATKIVEEFCSSNGIVSARQVQNNPMLFEEICRRLVEEAGLSLRKTAEHLETTHNKVYEILRENE
ncbi:MAG: transposase [bacterium]|nr:transposase [bacterium]